MMKDAYPEVKTSAQKLASTMNWPTKKDEEWRRTGASLFPLDRSVTLPGKGDFSPQDWAAYSAVLLISNGEAREVYKDSTAQGVEFLLSPEKDIQALLENHLAGCDNKVLASHFSQPSVHGVRFKKNSRGEKPVLVLVRESRPQVLVQPHLAVLAQQLSDWSLILRYESPEGSEILVNAASTFSLEDGARLNVTELQILDKTSSFIDHALADVGRDAAFDHLNVSLGAGITKGRLKVRLQGAGSDLHTRGLYFALGDQHKDLNVIQDHIAPQATSRALYKGAVRDRARAVFQGLIVVEPNAAGTDAYLSNKNLLMNDGARADSLPQLKIDNNDVKCSHGSTTGKVDEDQVFFLQSRGLTRQEAKLLIAQGLFAELVDSAPGVLKEELEALIAEAVL